MIFIKILNLFLIILICSYLGNLKAKTYDNRVIELSNFRNSILLLKNKIEFTYEPINNIFSEISKIIYENKDNIFKEIIKRNGELPKLWNDEINKIKNLKTDDKEIIKVLGKNLGKTDIKGQVSQLELSLKLIERQIENAENEKNKNYKLYKKLGGISGIAICIILL